MITRTDFDLMEVGEPSDLSHMAPASPQTKARRHLYARKGLNRLAVIHWVLYAVWMVWYPIHFDFQERQAAFDRTIAIFDICLKTHGEQCSEDYQNNWKQDTELYKIGDAYTKIGWSLFWLAPVALFIPPIVVYGIIRGLLKTGRWVVKGFTD